MLAPVVAYIGKWMYFVAGFHDVRLTGADLDPNAAITGK